MSQYGARNYTQQFFVGKISVLSILVWWLGSIFSCSTTILNLRSPYEHEIQPIIDLKFKTTVFILIFTIIVTFASVSPVFAQDDSDLLSKIRLAEEELASMIVYEQVEIPIHTIKVDEQKMELYVGIDINYAEIPIYEYEEMIQQIIGEDIPLSVGFAFFSLSTGYDPEYPLDNMATHILGPTGSDPFFTVSNDEIYAVWTDTEGVWFGRTSDEGFEFSDKTKISDASYVFEPKVAISDNNIYISWINNDYENYQNRDVFFAKSNNSGTTFENPVNLSNNDIDSAAVNFVDNRIVSSPDGRDIYVMWVIGNYDWTQVYLAKSHDSGKSFGPARNISNLSDDHYPNNPQISLSEKNLYISWEQASDGNIPPTNLKFMQSNNKGDIFGKTQTFENVGSTPNDYLFSERREVYLMWFDQEGISITKSTDHGKTFSEPIVLGHGAYPSMSFFKGYVFVSWIGHDNYSQVFFAKSKDGSKAFSDITQLSNHTSQISPYALHPFPKTMSDETNVVVHWMYNTNPPQSWVAISSDAGNNFRIVDLNKITQNNKILQSTLDEDSLYVSYHNKTSNNIQINKIQNLNSTSIVDFSSDYVIVEDVLYDFSAEQKVQNWIIVIIVIGVIIFTALVVFVIWKKKI